MQTIRSYVRARPKLFFATCTGVALAAWPLPFMTEPNGNMALLPAAATWLSLGLVAGMLVPERPWRWALAMMLANPILGLVIGLYQLRFFDALIMPLLTSPMLVLMATPIAAAAYVGRFLVVGRDPAHQNEAPSRRTQTRAGLVSGALCAVALIGAPSAWSLGSLALATAICGLWFSAQSGISMWRMAGLCIAGALVGYVALVMYDSASGGSNHNLMPFELWLVLAVSAPVAVISTWMGSLWRQYHHGERPGTSLTP